MSELLFESPVLVGVTGIALTLIALITWIKGGFSAALYSAVVLLLITMLLIGMSQWIQTDREQLDDTLQKVAAAVQANDLPAVMRFIHPAATSGLNRARTELPSYKFSEARITGVKSIEVDSTSNPPSAIAEFYVAVSISAHQQTANGIRRFVRAYFFKEGERWLVHDYQHFDINEGMKGLPGQ
ncbi:MAG: hypothetical protein IT423_19200 [Pirellulaceae bacterium]|nr:hypothetical protein [Pirellulaceae bacterium]